MILYPMRATAEANTGANAQKHTPQNSLDIRPFEKPYSMFDLMCDSAAKTTYANTKNTHAEDQSAQTRKNLDLLAHQTLAAFTVILPCSPSPQHRSLFTHPQVKQKAPSSRPEGYAATIPSPRPSGFLNAHGFNFEVATRFRVATCGS